MRYYIDKEPHSIVFAATIKDLYNNHTYNFDGTRIGAGRTRHTFLDWFLVPKERPSIAKAPVKEYYIDIPGTNGGLDLTESLAGFPLYDYIEGSFTFTILNDRVLPIINNKCEKTKEVNITWEILNRDIRDFLNGKKMYMMLEDDPTWYYYGRFTVNKYDSSEAANSKIEISYKVYPYKRLSKYEDSNVNYKNIYFDCISLQQDETKYLYMSFWNKKNMQFYPGNQVVYDGSSGGLPCGRESTDIKFTIQKNTDSLKPHITFTGGVNTDIDTDAGSTPQTVTVRGVTLTNIDIDKNNYIYNNSILYSDETLVLSLPYPEEFSSGKDYKKGDVIAHASQQSDIKWILIANTDITSGNDIDITQWDVDETAMPFDEFSTTATYSTGDIVYVKDVTDWPNKIVLCQATTNVSAGPFTSSEWDISFALGYPTLYTPVTITINYDIGVM